MIKKLFTEGVLSGNQLKLLALVSMTIDHIGVGLFVQTGWLRIVGRIAFPIFAYMIAEGCKYTKSRKRYLTTLVVMAALCQAVAFVAQGTLYQCILVTFSLSVAFIYILEYAAGNKNLQSFLLALVALVGIYFAAEILPMLLPGTDYGIDYGFWGIMLPVAVFFADTKAKKLVAAGAVSGLVCLAYPGIQIYSLVSIALLALYNGKRGKLRMKNLFYIYYPAHLAAIYLISMFLN